MQATIDILSAAVAEEAAAGNRIGGLYFSQCGEDVVLWHFLNEKSNGFYVDVGAHDPYRFSNTHLLHRYRQWRGVNVDLDERAVQAFTRARPDDINLRCAVSDVEEEIEVTVFEDGAINTADPGMAEHMQKTFPVKQRQVMKTVTLESILDRHLPSGQHIDLLSVDVEGLDMRVLAGNDWTRYRPTFVLVERHGLDLERLASDDVHRFLSDFDYKLVSHTVITSIYRMS